MGTKYAWTPERRAQQAQRARATKPWLKSTGPNTLGGKTASSQNAKLSEGLRDARNRHSQIKKAILTIFDRQRAPRGWSK